MIHYILQTVAFQLIFLLAYDVFLKRDTFFKWNRLYLLATAMLSLILPFIKLESFKKVVPQNYIITLPEVVLGQSDANANNTVALNAVVLKQHSVQVWELVFYIGLIIAFLLFLYKIFKIAALVVKNPKQSVGNIVLVELLNSTAAFSFFHYIFLGEKLKAEDKETILKHELIHTQQKHTFDLLFFEVLRIVFWFNPFVYIYQSRMATLHEFIADAHAVKHQNKAQYYQNLLAEVFETKNISFINTFFKQSLIKKRIVMLSKTKSKQINLLKYALLIPLVFGMLVYTSCTQTLNAQNKKNNTNTEQKKESPLVKKIKAVKEQIAVQGHVNKEEEKGLSLLLDIVKEETFNANLVEEVLRFTNQESKSELVEKISAVFEQIQVQGNLNDAEEKELKNLLVLTSDDGLNNPLFADVLNDVEVPFAVIDQVPIYPGCEDLTSEEQKKCISENISKHVQRNFNTGLANTLGLTGRQRINVIFKIDTEGQIKGIRSRAPHPDLEAEAIRVIKTLPKMIPGKQKGKAVTVPYSLPIIFQVADKTADDKTKTVAYQENKKKDIFGVNMEEDIEVPFAVIEHVPVYPGCEEGNNAEKKKCMSEKISNFVAENFNTKIADANNLSGRQRINVIFKIDKEGHITGVRSRAAHPALEAEAIRVISALPKMKPGVQRGKAVTVPYSLPIIFEVEDTEMLDEVTVNNAPDASNTSNELPFAIVDKAPMLPVCKSLKTEKEKRTCTSRGISEYVNKNFNTNLASQLGLKGRQSINVVFKITKKGKIEIEKSRAPHPDLEAEAIRVLKSIPKMIPGKQGGKKVDVIYSLPIIFQVNE
ncbi:energy transducer TonB [Hwangdonia lutea]|uniref:Energy transducer TonB n=1 Tax=Hwangdonia lutea TaxID=3075823 RepID=A0AA97ENI1_9FLAO|nr:energy transducer TonB [Hwangdonia sp. SCSIO 19198]WOD44639.1 energy transducer TonB [Hwangdonia sp. SCSIO 19198]